jgi:N-acetylated-alpha-linked acidic dipeptidase
MMSVPSAQNAMEIETNLSSVPHRAGSAADYATAMYLKQRLDRDGFTTRVVEYHVMFTGPLSQSLELVSPAHRTFDLLEGVPGHHTKWETMAGQPFLEESGDGDVTGPVVYVNRATKDDMAEIDADHVDLNGAVVIVRLGGAGAGGLSSIDPKYVAYDELRKRGVAAILEFLDPGTSGYGGGAMWPDGNFKNVNMAERMGGMSPRGFMKFAPGDPTIAGQAPVAGAVHKDWNDIPHATIPELSITQSVARTLLSGMTGGVVPSSWHPMFEFVQHFGGNERVRVRTQFERKVKTIWLVFGDMQGTEQPNSIVMIGSHRDAMTFGAIDPGSGTTVLLQDADAFHALAARGWKPKRTIEIASWDGHELGLYGSAAYIYEHGADLRKNVFQYINTDQLTTGDPFVVSASPGLYAFMKQIADVVPGRDGTMLGMRDQRKEPLLNAMSGGSDHQNFAYMLGTPSTSNGYYGAFGAHHTAEDNLDGLRTYDPGMKEAVITAQVTGIQAMRAANATVSPIRIEEEPAQLLKDFVANEAAALQMTSGHIEPLAEFQSKLEAYRDAAHKADIAMEAAEAAGDNATMIKLAAKIQASRDAFYVPQGLLENPYYHTIDRVFVSFPEMVFSGGDRAVAIQAAQRLDAAVTTATAALQ